MMMDTQHPSFFSLNPASNKAFRVQIQLNFQLYPENTRGNCFTCAGMHLASQLCPYFNSR